MKTIKTKSIVSAYAILMSASLAGMESNDKFNVIKSIRAMKPVADEYESFNESAREKLKGENHDEMCRLAEQWRNEGDEKTTLSLAQRIAVTRYFDNYGSELQQCLKEEEEKEHDVDIRTLSEEAFGQLLSANDKLTVEQIMLLQDCMCD